MRRIGGRLGSLPSGVGGAASEIPPMIYSGSNPRNGGQCLVGSLPGAGAS